MKSYLILIPIFIFTLLQGAFLPFNLVLLTVLFFTVFNPDKRSLWVAFGGGLLLDLAQGTSFGLSAAIFLFLSLVLLLYSRRFESTHWLFLTFFVFISHLVYSLLVWHKINWPTTLFLVFLTLLVLFILRLFPMEKKGSLKLKV